MDITGFFDSWTGWGVLVAANLPLFWLNYWLLFKDLEEFGEAIFMTLRPDIFSFFAGELEKDWWLSIKFTIFMAVNVGIIAGEIYLITEYFT